MGDGIGGLRRVLFVSQRQAEAMRTPLAAALISITDTRRPPATLGAGWSAVLRLAFDDVDPVTFPAENPDLTLFSVAQAAEVAHFIAKHRHRTTRLVVHCRHGISRSSAVAKAVADALGLAFPASYAEFNRHVHAHALEALCELGSHDCAPS